MAAATKESTIAGLELVAAATPVRVKMHAPMMAPMPRAMSAAGPRERLRECSPVISDSLRIRSSGFTANKFIVSVLSFPNHLFHYAQKIAAHDFLNVGFAVTALEQGRHQRRHFRSVFQAFRNIGDSVKMRADAHVVDACDFHDVVDVRYYVVNGSGRGPGTRPVLLPVFIRGIVVQRLPGHLRLLSLHFADFPPDAFSTLLLHEPCP